MDVFGNWRQTRIQTILILHVLANQMDKIQKEVNIAKVTGTCVSVAFGIGSAVAGVLAIFTFGASAPVSIVFGVVAGAGGATTVGSIVVKHFKDKSCINEAQKAVNTDHRATEDLKRFFRQLQSLNEIYTSQSAEGLALDEILSRIEGVDSIPTRSSLRPGDVVSRVGWIPSGASKINALLRFSSIVGEDIVLNAAPAVGKAVVNFGDDAIRCASHISSATEVFAVIGKVTKIAGPVVGFVCVGFDIYELVRTSYDIHKKSLNAIAKDIRKKANILELELQTVCDMIN